jgi:predicted dehydrogenase
MFSAKKLMKAKLSFSRRQFLKHSSLALGALAAGPLIVPGRVLGADGAVSPGNRITLGMIGTGDHGIDRNLRGFLAQSDAQVVAVCDVDRGRREMAKQLVEQQYASKQEKGTFKGCASYNDFRELLDRKDIDAVMISTPDHWHVIPAVLAAKAGKDVICEKPLTLTVAEGRILSDTMTKHGRIFQTASENRSYWNYRHICELVRNGRIGKLKHIEVGLPGGWWVRNASRELTPPPEGLDYDLWLGQAPEAPYSAARCHWNFRWITDYSGGMLTDWGAHMIDIAQWGNNTEETGPVEVEATGSVDPDPLYNTATKFEVNCKYANGVTLRITSAQPSIRFEGTDGWLGNSGWNAGPNADPESILDYALQPGDIRLYGAPNEHRNFLDCVKSRKPCYAPAEVGHRTISIAHLGNISMKVGRKIKWDPDNERIPGDDAANKLLSREARAPWQLEKLA